ncbi:high-affinity Zn(2+) transporter zrt1 [Entomortierella lignicola]|nr:high-affinity Zn(2+) transporter zrt1 [Entomortierella lignicola]
MSLPIPSASSRNMSTDSYFATNYHDETKDQTQYNVIPHIAGVFIILAASSAGVFMPLIASRFRSLGFSPRVLTLGKQFGTGIILATAFIHMMPTAMTNLSSPCLGPVFSENYTAFGGLFILSSSLFMHWIEFVAVEHNQHRMNKAALEKGIEIKDGEVNMDLGGLGATGVAAVPCPGHTVMVMDDEVCQRSSCTSVSSCSLDHRLEDLEDAGQGSSNLLDDTSPFISKNMRHQGSYGSIVEYHNTRLNSKTSQEALIKPTHDRDDHHHHRHNHHHHSHEVQHSHSHGLELLNDSERKISTYILEAGVAAHSVIIGISLGVSSGAEFMSLLTAMVFHQFFEGFALGARIADLDYKKSHIHYLLAMIFSLTTPGGAVIGIAISSTYNASSPTSILMEGIFDSISTGILLYMGYVNLLAVEFNMNGEIRKESTKVKSMCFLALWAGAAVMAVIGIFA